MSAADKPCANCGYAPRMISHDGQKTLTMCEKCQRAYWNKKKAEKQQQGTTPRKRGPKKSVHTDIPEGHKRCSICKKVLPATEEHFYYKSDRGGRLNSHCKACHNHRRKPDQEQAGHKKPGPKPTNRQPAPLYKFLLIDPNTGKVRVVEAIVISEADLTLKNKRELNPSTEEFFRWKGYEVAELKAKAQQEEVQS